MQSLEDFTLDLSADGKGGYAVRVLASPAGEGRGDFGTAPEAGELVRFFAGLKRVRGSKQAFLRDLVPVSRPSKQVRSRKGNASKENARELGERLFRALFPDPVDRLFRTSRALAADRGKGLRIRIRLDAAQEDAATLHRIPWELLFDPVEERFLAWSREAPVVRYLELAQPFHLPPLPRRLSILVLMANPEGSVDLDLAAERAAIEQVWQDHPAVAVRFLPSCEGQKATFETLRRALLASETHVLHFMGHGRFDRGSGQGTLSFERENGRSDAVSGEALAGLLGDFDALRLVVLNACHTAEAAAAGGQNPFAGVATALVRGGVPAVVAMQAAVSDRAAIAFSRELYHRLAQGEPVDLAVVEGRRGIGRPEKTDEWAIPVLFLRGTDDRLFAAPAAERAPVERPPAWSWSPRGAFLLAASVLGLALFAGLGSLWLMRWPALRLSLAAGVSLLAAVVALLLHQDPIPGRRLSHWLARRRWLGLSCAALPLAAVGAWAWTGPQALCRAECGELCSPPGVLRVLVEPFSSHFSGDQQDLSSATASQVAQSLNQTKTVWALADVGLEERARRCVDFRLRGALDERDDEVVLEVEVLGPGGRYRDRVEVRGRSLVERGSLLRLQNRLVLEILGAFDMAPDSALRTRIHDFPTASEDALDLNRRGVRWFQERNYYEAGTKFSLALKLDPGYADAANNLGMVRLRQRDFGAASSLFRQAIEQFPRHATYPFNLGLALDRAGQPQAAAEAYRRAYQLDPSHARALNNLGFVLLQLEQLAEARRALDEGLGWARDPRVRASLAKNLGVLELKLSHPQQALEHLDRALEHFAPFPEALFLRAQALEQWPPGQDRACSAWRAYAVLAAQDESVERRQVGLARVGSLACLPES